jgi:predicted TIM-barrel fold metal-dependent hydrolase
MEAVMTTSLEDIAIAGRALDADAHEMAPIEFWEEVFGPAAARTAVLLHHVAVAVGPDQLTCPDLKADDGPINAETVWTIRGNRAPSAIDLGRRVEVLDTMGIDKQLIFPTFAILANVMATADEVFLRSKWGLTIPLEEIRQLGREGLEEYNSWAARITALAPDRLRPVAYVVDDGTPEDLMAQTKELTGRGIRAVNLPSGTPPGGLSPADPKLDEFWGFLEGNDIPVVLHVGGELGFVKTAVWGEAPVFAPGKITSVEVGIDPFSFATMHFPSTQYLSALVLGGVFDRFPRLRFGVIELGCSWLGQFAEGLDMWARDVFHRRMGDYLSMLPSEYIARNVRVSPFNTFEPIEKQFERYPHLSDCYCYSSDYPHFEGGLDSMRLVYDRLAPLGDDVLERFFFKNAELLLP